MRKATTIAALTVLSLFSARSAFSYSNYTKNPKCGSGWQIIGIAENKCHKAGGTWTDTGQSSDVCCSDTSPFAAAGSASASGANGPAGTAQMDQNIGKNFSSGQISRLTPPYVGAGSQAATGNLGLKKYQFQFVGIASAGQGNYKCVKFLGTASASGGN